MPPHPATLDDQTLLAACRTRRGRVSGPGGQHRNKVETAVTLVHQPSGVSAAASERRSQAANHKQALWRLRLKLATSLRSEHADPQPSQLWRSRRSNGRIAVNARHAHFPALLAEALDALDHADHDLAAAAAQLGVSSSQLVKLIAKHPPALALVNQTRAARGLFKLK